MTQQTSVPELDRRPLPDLDAWLAEHGDGRRGEGFDQFKDLLERSLVAQPVAALSPPQQTFMRLWMGLSIAVIECANIELAKGVDHPAVIRTLPRAAACAIMGALASVLQDDAPLRKIAKLVTEDFRFGAKESADQLLARLDAADGEGS